MQSKSIFHIIISILILISLSQLCSADVEIPFDYYYGRWIDGHQVGGFYEIRDDAEDYSKQLDYLFTNGKYQIGFDLTTRYDLGISGYGDDGWVTPNVSFQLRPNSHWQIGVDDAYYAETSRKMVPYNNRFVSYNDIENTGNISLSSQWINKSMAKLTIQQSMLSYYITPLVNQGTLRIDNHYNYRNYLERRFYVNERYDSSYEGINTENRKYYYRVIDFNNTIQYGINNNLNLKLNLNYHANCSDADSYSLYYVKDNTSYYIISDNY
ncbi:MAG: hypothetical protein ABIJ12_05950, partial [bacterium]